MTRRRIALVTPPSLMGAKEAGQHWETELDRLHRGYQAAGQAVIARTPPEVRLVGGGRWQRMGDGPTDYVGVAGALALAIEAKTSEDGKFGFDLLKEHQSQFMLDWERQDRRNLGVVLHWDRAADQCWAIPWEDLADRWLVWHAKVVVGRRARSGTASLDGAQLARIGIPFTLDTGGWLPPVRAWAARRTA